MEVEFVIRVDDHLAFHRYYLERRPPAGSGRLVVLVLLFGLLGGLMWLNYNRGGWADITAPVVLTVVFIAFAVLAVFQRRLFVGQVLRAMRRQLDDEWSEKLLGWRRLSIDPDGITVVSELTTASTLWQAVEQIAVTDDYAFFFLTRRTGFVLPARAFPDDEGFQDFVKTARHYRRTADEAPRKDPPSRRRSQVEETGFTAGEPTGD
jgi:hypothetical protein